MADSFLSLTAGICVSPSSLLFFVPLLRSPCLLSRPLHVENPHLPSDVTSSEVLLGVLQPGTLLESVLDSGEPPLLLSSELPQVGFTLLDFHHAAGVAVLGT